MGSEGADKQVCVEHLCSSSRGGGGRKLSRRKRRISDGPPHVGITGQRLSVGMDSAPDARVVETAAGYYMCTCGRRHTVVYSRYRSMESVNTHAIALYGGCAFLRVRALIHRWPSRSLPPRSRCRPSATPPSPPARLAILLQHAGNLGNPTSYVRQVYFPAFTAFTEVSH